MVWERKVLIDEIPYIVVVSDEAEALLAAQAVGRAVVGVAKALAMGPETAETDNPCTVPREGGWDLKGIPYVIPSWEDATAELLELVLRRRLGIPWIIDETERLIIREFVREDALCIPEEEYGREEAIFRDLDRMELYIKNQYGFYEYGTWALVHRDTGQLIGMSGVSNPRLPNEMKECLDKLGTSGCSGMEATGPGAVGERSVISGECPLPEGERSVTGGEYPLPERIQSPEPTAWLELGYHIFRPWRGQGYAREAAEAVVRYSHEVLSSRLCALVEKNNRPSCLLAEHLGMKAVMEGGGTGGQEGTLLYAGRPLPIGT